MRDDLSLVRKQEPRRRPMHDNKPRWAARLVEWNSPVEKKLMRTSDRVKLNGILCVLFSMHIWHFVGGRKFQGRAPRSRGWRGKGPILSENVGCVRNRMLFFQVHIWRWREGGLLPQWGSHLN